MKKRTFPSQGGARHKRKTRENTGVVEKISGRHVVRAVQHYVVLRDDGEGGGGGERDVVGNNLKQAIMSSRLQYCHYYLNARVDFCKACSQRGRL